MAKMIELGHGVKVSELAYQYKGKTLFTEPVVKLISHLHGKFGTERDNLLKARIERQSEFDQGKVPEYLTDHPAQSTTWSVHPIPEDMLERRVEITGPVNSTKMVIQMLSRGADGARADTAMLDFEDSMKPSWKNIVDGVGNVAGAAARDLVFTQAKPDGSEKVYKLNPEDMAHPMARVRGLHLTESNVTVNDVPVSGGLLDLSLCASHSAQAFLDSGMTPKYYIPKTEHFLESRWWNGLLSELEQELTLPASTLRCTLLIETLPAAFQMEEILYEIRAHACGLNGGRWDKIFSDIKVLRNHKDRIMANRSYIDMSRPWMDQYAQRLIKICHKHGAFGMGGMSAFTPGKSSEVRKVQTEKVRADKAREAEIGHDGCWVSHPYFIAIAREQFTAKNQLNRSLKDFPDHPELLPLPEGPKTMAGLRKNIRVGMAYQNGWNQDIGCVSFDGLMEDLATLEICRAQTWQWLHHKVTLDDGGPVTPDLVKQLFDEECHQIIEEVKSDLASGGRSELFEDQKNAYLQAKAEVQSLFLNKELKDFFSLESDIVETPI